MHPLELNSLTAISPLDGRYASKTAALRDFFSEYALIKYRVIIEVEWLKALANAADIIEIPPFTSTAISVLDSIVDGFSLADAERIKAIETTTNHDVKAVEYFLKEKFETLGLSLFKEFIHFGLTSQDINNTAIPLSTKEAFEKPPRGCRKE